MKPSIEQALAAGTAKVDYDPPTADPATPSTKESSHYPVPSAEELGIPRQAPPIFNKPPPLDVVEDRLPHSLTYREAIQHILNGHKVRRATWPAGVVLGIQDRGVELLSWVGYSLEPMMNEEATDWEVT